MKQIALRQELGLAQAALGLVVEKAPKRSISFTFYDVQTDAATVQPPLPRRRCRCPVVSAEVYGRALLGFADGVTALV